jgi:hypothetical protein
MFFVKISGFHSGDYEEYRLEGCVLQTLVTANVPSSPILANLMMKATRSSETSILTRPTRHHIQENGILQILLVFKSSHMLERQLFVKDTNHGQF